MVMRVGVAQARVGKPINPSSRRVRTRTAGGEEPMGIFHRLARRWLGLTKIAIAIEKKVAKQASAYHLS
jgi:hypothetical protein